MDKKSLMNRKYQVFYPYLKDESFSNKMIDLLVDDHKDKVLSEEVTQIEDAIYVAEVKKVLPIIPKELADKLVVSVEPYEVDGVATEIRVPDELIENDPDDLQSDLLEMTGWRYDYLLKRITKLLSIYISKEDDHEDSTKIN